MGNPKKLSSYPPAVIALIETYAQAKGARSTTFTFPTRGACVTFRSKFYSCRKLLAELRAEHDPDLANKIYRVGCRMLDDTNLEVTNTTSRLPENIEDEIWRAIAEINAAESPSTQQAPEPREERRGPEPFNPYLIDHEEDK